MEKIRTWSVPVGLIVAWLFVSGYTIHALVGAQAAWERRAAVIEAPPVVITAEEPTRT